MDCLVPFLASWWDFSEEAGEEEEEIGEEQGEYFR